MRLPWRRRPPDMTIGPSVPEWEDHAADYEEWVEAARMLGLRVELMENKPPHSGADLPDFIPLGFVVYVAVKLTDAVLDLLVDQAKSLIVKRARTRWWTRGKRVKGVIYGPNGEILREVIWASREGERPDYQARDKDPHG